MYKKAQYVNDPFTNKIYCIKVSINGITSFVPLDPANTDYQNIMRLVEANELQIADPE